MKMCRVLAILIVGLVFISVPIRGVEEASTSKGIILIDPGHGGADGGAKSKKGTVEKYINLDISNKLKDKLQEEGYEVYMTRDDDESLSDVKRKDLAKRCKMKEETKCDVFISIHQNKFNKSSCFGAQVWYASNEKSQKIADFLQESIKETVCDDNKRVSKPAKNQYKILRDGYDCASVIVECGFISNPKEEIKLKSEEHQDKLVEGMVLGINKYFE